VVVWPAIRRDRFAGKVFSAMHGDVPRRGDSQLNAVPADCKDLQTDVLADQYFLFTLAGNDQHRVSSLS